MAAIVFSLAVPLAACGDGDEQVSADELVSKGDELCRQGRERFAEIQSQPPSNASDAVDQTRDLVGVAGDELEGLRNLRPPEELQESYDRYLDARERALELLEEGRDAAEAKDADAYAEAQAEVTKGQPQRLELAQAVGFTECSRP